MGRHRIDTVHNCAKSEGRPKPGLRQPKDRREGRSKQGALALTKDRLEGRSGPASPPLTMDRRDGRSKQGLRASLRIVENVYKRLVANIGWL